MLKSIMALMAIVFLSSDAYSTNAKQQTGLQLIQRMAKEPNNLIQHFEGEQRKQFLCLALNVYHEYRGKEQTEQVRIALVTRNRVESPLFPKTYCDVVFQNQQFKWTNRNIPAMMPYEKDAWQMVLKSAYMVFADPEVVDITNGALFFVEPQRAKTGFLKDMILVADEGIHKYFKFKDIEPETVYELMASLDGI